MTKTSKSERKYGADVEKKPPKRRNSKKDIGEKVEEEMYKILVDGSGFSKAMPYEDCIKVITEMEAKAAKLRRPKPSLMLIKQ
jgi:hypothetical protein|tara:strand:+ start:181 stop:429 length:249 start_codon:yes stop_codon:yes gene_type:complete